MLAEGGFLAAHFGLMGGARGTKELQKGPWDQVKGCEEAPGRHQGGTREAPRRHQGGTKEAPSRHLHIVMGPRALLFQRREL